MNILFPSAPTNNPGPVPSHIPVLPRTDDHVPSFFSIKNSTQKSVSTQSIHSAFIRKPDPPLTAYLQVPMDRHPIRVPNLDTLFGGPSFFKTLIHDTNLHMTLLGKKYVRFTPGLLQPSPKPNWVEEVEGEKGRTLSNLTCAV